jgi:hypothetical protein
MLELQVAGSPTSGWHTITNANTPASSMQVAEVQAYSASQRARPRADARAPTAMEVVETGQPPYSS